MRPAPVFAAFLVLLLHPFSASCRLSLLASFAPIYSFALNVSGNAADVSVLIPPTTGPHDYSFSPGDIARIARADIIIVNGAGLENWLNKGLKTAGKEKLSIVDTSRGIDLIRGLEVRRLPGVTSEPDSDAGGPNPHIWLSPRNAIVQVRNIRDALSAHDPQNAKTYAENAEAYIQRLTELDRDIIKATEKLTNRTLITFHDSFPYFARDYGFKVAATFEEFPGKEPTPGAIRQLREIIHSSHVVALFSEPQYSPRAMQVFSQEFHIPIIQLDPLETGQGGKDFYEAAMRKNLEALVTAFHG